MDKNQQGQLALAGLFICIGLMLAGLFLKKGIENFKAMDRVVTVKGLSEKEVKADRVIWPLMYKEIGDDLITLNSTVTIKNEAIVSYLTSHGLTPEEITVSAPEIVDMKAERYSNTPVTYRYNVTSVVTVASSKVDLVRNLMNNQNVLIKQGIAITSEDYSNQKQFLFTRLNQIKPGMIQEATQNARASALKFAQDSESKLGKIKTADQGQFSITDRDANTPYIKSVRVVTTICYYLED
ncbi:MAG: SIMPL domain-containing protein [Bacteroidota bacterium]|nr:SIMPL domain-containing protein [Bacteroidota bacterium]